MATTYKNLASVFYESGDPAKAAECTAKAKAAWS
ncbi:MAG: hypothetical protein HQL61_03300 [Magnetococcales bacterium]|nr:hypothetical protein [Nitrospirota bacterium]